MTPPALQHCYATTRRHLMANNFVMNNRSEFTETFLRVDERQTAFAKLIHGNSFCTVIMDRREAPLLLSMLNCSPEVIQETVSVAMRATLPPPPPAPAPAPPPAKSHAEDVPFLFV